MEGASRQEILQYPFNINQYKISHFLNFIFKWIIVPHLMVTSRVKDFKRLSWVFFLVQSKEADASVRRFLLDKSPGVWQNSTSAFLQVGLNLQLEYFEYYETTYYKTLMVHMCSFIFAWSTCG